MSEELPIRSLVDQLKPFIEDKGLRGRLYADLTDILEVCNWFVSAVRADSMKPLTRDELETLLVDFDVNMLQHLAYHLDSLRKDMPAVLDAVGQREDKEAE